MKTQKRIEMFEIYIRYSKEQYLYNIEYAPITAF